MKGKKKSLTLVQWIFHQLKRLAYPIIVDTPEDKEDDEMLWSISHLHQCTLP